MDFDGTEAYLEIKILNFSSDKIETYPNPADHVLNLVGYQDSDQIQIFDFSGQRVTVEQTTDEFGIKINTTSLPNGIYFIKSSRINFPITKFVVLH